MRASDADRDRYALALRDHYAAGRRRLLAGRGYRVATAGAALLLVAAGGVLAVEGVRAL